MRLEQRSSMIVLTVLTLALAFGAGLIIPLASGSRLGAAPPPWTPPSPTATAIPPTATALPAVVAKPPSPTAKVTQPAPTIPSLVTPQVSPTSLVASPTAAATIVPPTATSVPTPTRMALLQAPVAQVMQGPLLLRIGPERDQPVLGIGDEGSTFTVTARTSDSAWLQVCCVKGELAWLSAQFVAITGTIASLPVKP